MGGEEPIAGDTAGRTFHALTVIDGAAEVVARDGALRLNRFDSAVIPAACGAYEIRPLDGCRVLKSEHRLTGGSQDTSPAIEFIRVYSKSVSSILSGARRRSIA